VSWWGEDALDRARWGPLVADALGRIVAARDRGRFPHAILLVGPPGLGRELLAVETAVLVTCEGAEEPWSSSGCADRIRRGLHPDVVGVFPQGAAHKIKIEQVREVVESAPGRPFEGLSRVWIFDGAEAGRFGAEAANAFLKTLEEPPGHVRFLLLAANPSAVLATVRSRCQVLTLPGPVAVAHALGDEVRPELMAAAGSGSDITEVATEVEATLCAAFAGEVQDLLRLSVAAADETPTFEVIAAVAVEMAGREQDPDRAAELVRLAADLLATDRRARGLNLNPDRQLTSCLLRWQRELDLSAHSAD
jgi:replication-associated recombination protein RarA